MITDILGKKRYKLGLHLHTTLSDGRDTPEEVARIYKAAGYDAIALTDHWIVSQEGSIEGLRILPGCEYNAGASDSAAGVYHILGIGMQKDPHIPKGADAQEILDTLHQTEALAVLAHPAWSLNSVEQIRALRGIDATEIYNTVSGVQASNRPYSGDVIDRLANVGIRFPLLAADDAHYYNGDDETVSYIMVDVSDGCTGTSDLIAKIRGGEFYATQGPEVHLFREGDTVCVHCSPAQKISFFSQSVWNASRNTIGDGIIQAEYHPDTFETWVRAEVTDKDGKTAWSSILTL